MFRVIGGAVVYGLALYGAVKLFARQKRERVSQPGGQQVDWNRCGDAADVASDSAGTSTADQVSEASTESVSTGFS
jgi:hypothetical protein